MPEIEYNKKFVPGLGYSKFYPYLYILPALIFFVIYVFYPIIFSFILSLFKWDAIKPIAESSFVSFANYSKLFQHQF